MGLIIRPDCADLPYFLRAYFAFKMGLPFGYSKCTRGGGGEAPKCPQWWNIQNLEEARLAPPPRLNRSPRRVRCWMCSAGRPRIRRRSRRSRRRRQGC